MNPSVQDFLAGEAMDDNVIRAMASAVPRWKTAMRFWKTVRHAPAAPILRDVARVLLQRIVDGQLEGRIALHDLTMLIANLVIVTQDHEALTRLRKARTPKVYWILESKLPTLIETLETGLYSHLPNARGFARHLRRVLYRYLADDRDEAFEPGELSDLAEGLIDAHIEMPDSFVELFDEAVEETVELLDIHSIPKDSDPGPVIEEWIEHLDTIGTYTSSYAVISKKRQLEHHLGEIAHAEDLMMEEHHFAAPRSTDLPRQRVEGQSRPAGSWRQPGFTDADLGAMFSSLRKPD